MYEIKNTLKESSNYYEYEIGKNQTYQFRCYSTVEVLELSKVSLNMVDYELIGCFTESETWIRSDRMDFEGHLIAKIEQIQGDLVKDATASIDNLIIDLTAIPGDCKVGDYLHFQYSGIEIG